MVLLAVSAETEKRPPDEICREESQSHSRSCTNC